MDVDVCGWIGGNSAQPVACGSGSSCVYDTIHGYVGCCTTSGACTAGVYTSCVDAQSSDWNKNSGIVDDGIYTCTGTAVCYRNTYPGGYYQYACGASSEATSIATSFYGQPSDEFLQQVYTGVHFTPTSAPLSTSATPPTGTSTFPTIGQVTPITSPSPTSNPSKKPIGAITGGTIGGLAFLCALLALALALYRRHQKKYHYAGPFISNHSHPNQPPTSGPFQRISNSPYDTPDDFMKHRGGVTTTRVTAGEQFPHSGATIFPDTGEYAGAADPHHPYTNTPNIPYFQPNRSSQESYHDQERDLGNRERGREDEPLVGGGDGRSEIEDFSRSYHQAIAVNLRDGEEEGPVHSNSGVLPGGIGGTGIGMGSGLGGNHRTEDREARSEALRERLGGLGLNPPLGSHPVRGFSYDDVGGGTGNGDDREWKAQRLLVGLGSAVGRRGPEDERPRYALVDEIAGEDVPILQSPGQMRHERAKIRDDQQENKI